MIDPTEAGELLRLLIEQAPDLRAAGYTRISLGELSFDLRPFEPEAPEVDDDNDEEEKPKSAMDDRETFGGRRVPGRILAERKS